jgi:hypothetical protein
MPPVALSFTLTHALSLSFTTPNANHFPWSLPSNSLPSAASSETTFTRNSSPRNSARNSSSRAMLLA